jgi:hypothetical protein
MQRELRRFAERGAARESGGQELQYDSIARLATYEQRGGGVVSRHFTELLATYSPDDRILKWAWAGKLPAAETSHVDLVFREGQARGVPQLTMSLVNEVDEVEAHKLASLGALVSRARGMHVRVKEGGVEYIGLFDRSRPQPDLDDAAPFGSSTEEDQRYSVPPPVVEEKKEDKKEEKKEEHRPAYRSLPPIREIYEPRTRRSSAPPALKPVVREPAREIFVPVATSALAALSRSSPGYKQGLFAVTIDEDERKKRRIVVQLVALDAHGMLRVIDPPADLVDTTAKMIEADRSDGNGPWRKLHARITPKPNGGATLNVDVS